MEAHFFANADEFRNWLELNHGNEKELWVGYFKKHTGIPSMTWSESVDQALCFGWIDGIRKSIDEQRYRIRFTPRRVNSNWSNVNLKKMEVLMKADLVKPAGMAIFQKRNQNKIQQYTYEQENLELDKAYLLQIKSHPEAWAFFENLAPSYKKASIKWIMSAKRKETQLRRLGILIESSNQSLKIPPLRR